MGRVIGVSMRRKSEAGQALVFAVLALGILLMGFAGLGIDLGYLRYQKRLQQTAADGAAMAGAAELFYGSSGVTGAAQHDASSNGFTDTTGASGCPAAINCVTVAVNNPPASGPHSGDANFVEVIVTQVQPTFFMRILGINSESISARAVATSNNGNGCLYTLAKSGNGVSLSGFLNTLTANNCEIVDDSNMSLSGFFDTVSASSIGVAGTYTHGLASVTPTPVTGIQGFYDPLAYLTAPPTSGACIPNPNVSGSGGTVTINPGHYCNGITIQGSRNVVFSPGVYTITGANSSGFALQDTGSGSLTGNGVMFYNTVGGISLSVTGFSGPNLTAPTTNNAGTGQIAGMLFWQAAGDTTSATMGGGIAASLAGIIYMPGAQLTIQTPISVAPYTILVVNSLSLQGFLLTLSADTSSLPGGSPIRNTTLVE